MNQSKSIFDRVFYAGLVLNGLSIAVFTLIYIIQSTTPMGNRSDMPDGLPFISFLMVFIYGGVLFFHGIAKRKWKFMWLEKHHFLLLTTLFSISAFALNTQMHVFAEFTDWLKGLVLLLHVTLYGWVFVDYLPRPARVVLFLVTGISSVTTLYFALYLMPAAPIAIIGAIFLGLSLHLIAPHIVLLALAVQVFRQKVSAVEGIALTIGVVIPLIVVSVFLTKWVQTRNLVHDAHAAMVTRPDNTMPAWVLLSQRLPDDWITNEIIANEISYQGRRRGGRGIMDFNLFDGNFSRQVRHNPMVIIAQTVADDIGLGRDELIHILETRFDARHNSHRRLWTGDNLSTREVINNIEVFPDYRMAYLEKTLTIHNNRKSSSWRQQQEGVYTFHLPEGAIVSSLSLWINGVEEKSRLTTRQKADSAYSTIVGRERRDPALLHWQEGNRITVTVFPCTPEEDRIFKVGATIPLEKYGDELLLKNVFFEGPQIANARETSVIRFAGKVVPAGLDMPSAYEAGAQGSFTYTGDYRPYWELAIPAVPLSKKHFAFQGKKFHVELLKYEEETFDPERIYLDINGAWSRAEYDRLLDWFKDKKVYTYDEGIVVVDATNRDALFDRLSKDQFSMFPFDQVESPQSALVVSRSTFLSPNLKDMKGTPFYSHLKAWLETDPPKVRFYNIGRTVSPYIKSLKEFDSFEYAMGTPSQLGDYIGRKQFPTRTENAKTILIDQADISIVMEPCEVDIKEGGPDHMMRLFHYGQIMRQMGHHYFQEGKKYYSPELNALANEAFVVTPVSSLVVLESLKDYDRFDIKANKNSLKNASTGSSGSVPEPHEWALIILTLLLLGFLYLRQRGVQLWRR